MYFKFVSKNNSFISFSDASLVKPYSELGGSTLNFSSIFLIFKGFDILTDFIILLNFPIE